MLAVLFPAHCLSRSPFVPLLPCQHYARLGKQRQARAYEGRSYIDLTHMHRLAPTHLYLLQKPLNVRLALSLFISPSRLLRCRVHSLVRVYWLRPGIEGDSDNGCSELETIVFIECFRSYTYIIWLFKFFSIFTRVLACNNVREKPIERNSKRDYFSNNTAKFDGNESRGKRLW